MQGDGAELTAGTEAVTQAQAVDINEPQLEGSIPKTRGNTKLEMVPNRVDTPIRQIEVQFIAQQGVHQVPVKIDGSAGYHRLTQWLPQFHTNRCDSHMVGSSLVGSVATEIQAIE